MADISEIVSHFVTYPFLLREGLEPGTGLVTLSAKKAFLQRPLTRIRSVRLCQVLM
ncbi:hypothetical protein ASZ90_016184 [hydrocarbon metagenome]|uniref:Uncharacterized protein n=1 Tax=hydrocarbon metagenome TaxID=938273 RepID=A0A0W8EZY0_9ZZZZ